MKIALSGKMQSGKSTVAHYLEDTYDGSTYSFADQLKESLMLIGVPRDWLYNTKPDIVRRLMQVYGQVMRDVDEDWWVDIVLDDLEEDYDDDDLVVIDDLRFKNEARKLKDEGFVLVRVTKHPRQLELFPAPGSEDISETDLDDWTEWDYVIEAAEEDLARVFEQVDYIINEEEKR